MESLEKSLEAEIFVDGANTFAVLDGASVPSLLEKLEQWQPEFVCLYRGDLNPDLAEVAPYLLRLESGTEIAEWILSKGWGNHWGIFAIAEADLQAMRQHLRRFLTVYDENGKPLLFRFYDPRVLGTYLPLCNEAELATMFGPVSAYLLESEHADRLLHFEFANTALVTEKKDLNEDR